VKAHKTSGGRKMPVRHTIPLGIVIFLVLYKIGGSTSLFPCTTNFLNFEKSFPMLALKDPSLFPPPE